MSGEGMTPLAENLRQTVRVALDERSYDVIIGPDLLDDLPALAAECFGATRYAIVTDAHVAKSHLGPLSDALAHRG